ncbi:MAG: hypothetical protein FJW95_12105 [Actinobacteria bacterium]|nr:hypothetical protein [Actinomycetota bacterium]
MTTSTPTPSPAPAPAPAKPPLVKHPGRVLTVVLMLGAVVTLAIIGLSRAETDTGIARDAPLAPSAVEAVIPGPGELSGRQDTITVDLRDDFTGVLLVQPPDGPAFEVPEDQMDRVVPLGRLSWRPGENQELERYQAGNYKVTVLYWPQAKPRPETPAGYTWTFRAAL